MDKHVGEPCGEYSPDEEERFRRDLETALELSLQEQSMKDVSDKQELTLEGDVGVDVGSPVTLPKDQPVVAEIRADVEREETADLNQKLAQSSTGDGAVPKKKHVGEPCGEYSPDEEERFRRDLETALELSLQEQSMKDFSDKLELTLEGDVGVDVGSPVELPKDQPVVAEIRADVEREETADLNQKLAQSSTGDGAVPKKKALQRLSQGTSWAQRVLSERFSSDARAPSHVDDGNEDHIPRYPVGEGAIKKVPRTLQPVGEGAIKKSLRIPQPVGEGAIKKVPRTSQPVGEGAIKKEPRIPQPVGEGAIKKLPRFPQPVGEGAIKKLPRFPQPVGEGAIKKSPRIPQPVGEGAIKKETRMPQPVGEGAIKKSLRIPQPVGEGAIKKSLRIPQPVGEGAIKKSLRIPQPVGEGAIKKSLRIPQPVGEGAIKKLPRIPQPVGEGAIKKLPRIPQPVGEGAMKKFLRTPQPVAEGATKTVPTKLQPVGEGAVKKVLRNQQLEDDHRERTAREVPSPGYISKKPLERIAEMPPIPVSDAPPLRNLDERVPQGQWETKDCGWSSPSDTEFLRDLEIARRKSLVENWAPSCGPQTAVDAYTHSSAATGYEIAEKEPAAVEIYDWLSRAQRYDPQLVKITTAIKKYLAKTGNPGASQSCEYCDCKCDEFGMTEAVFNSCDVEVLSTDFHSGSDCTRDSRQSAVLMEKEASKTIEEVGKGNDDGAMKTSLDVQRKNSEDGTPRSDDSILCDDPDSDSDPAAFVERWYTSALKEHCSDSEAGANDNAVDRLITEVPTGNPLLMRSTKSRQKNSWTSRTRYGNKKLDMCPTLSWNTASNVWRPKAEDALVLRQGRSSQPVGLFLKALPSVEHHPSDNESRGMSHLGENNPEKAETESEAAHERCPDVEETEKF